VYRGDAPGRRWLILRRACAPADDADWAWGPPAGVRLAGEEIDACARRELFEETGLSLDPEPVDTSRSFALYVAECPRGAHVHMSDEHDRFRWVPLHEALRRCRPDGVKSGLLLAARAVCGRLRPHTTPTRVGDGLRPSLGVVD
jgi:8-oxo-dGTP pyrophosphatase MutT (NUDIX family)